MVTKTRRKKKTTRSVGRNAAYEFDLRTKKGTLDVFTFMHAEMETQGMDRIVLAGRADMSVGTLYRWFGPEPPVIRGPFARQLVAVFNALGYDVVTRRA